MLNQAHVRASARCSCIAIVVALGAFLPSLHSQTVSAAAVVNRLPSPSQLVKYDLNRDGKLDAAEQARFEAGEQGNTTMLTPFEVSTDKDRGYAAGNTVSGGRVDTPLALTAASISVMTKEFMEDFDITDINQAAAWTLNMDAPANGSSGPFGTDRFESNFRGAGGGGSGSYPTRNGVQNYFVADSYNSERFEFSRGPNSQMFGPGGPGGMQGSGSKQPRYGRLAVSASTRFDSYGSYRGSVDFNQGYNRFAVRVNVLHQTTKSYLDGTSNRQNAITLAVAFKITENTQLRAEFERSTEHNIQFRKTWAEQASLWDQKTFNDTNTLIANQGSFGLGQLGNATTDRLIYNFGTKSLINYKGIQYQTSGLGYQIPQGGRLDLPREYYGSANFHPGFSKNFRLGPIDNIADRDNNTRTISLEHRFTPNLFMLFTWVGSDIDPVTLYSQGHPGDYRIDVNRLLPDGITTNPNFKKAYSDWGQNSQYQQNGNDEYLWMTNYQYAAPRLLDMKQYWNVNAGYRLGLYEAWNRAWRWVNNPAQLNPTNGVNTLNFRIYYDNPRPSIAPFLNDAAINALDPTKTFRNTDNGFHAFNRGQLTYGALTTRTSFLNEKINLTIGYRRDKVVNDNLSNIGNDPLNNYRIILGGLNPVTKVNEAGFHSKLTTFRVSKNADLVTYPFKDMGNSGFLSSVAPYLRPLGFVANFSQNFQIPPTGDPLISGERPEPPFSETLDLGVRYSIPGGIAYVTLSHYNTDNIGRLETFGSQTELRNIWRNLGYTDTAHFDFGGYRDSSDRKLEGWEFEVTANPTRNLTLTANYSHPLVRTVLESRDRRAYVAANLPEWRAGAAATTGQIIGGRTILDPVIIANSILTIENSFNGSTAGTIGNGALHRANFAASYRFTEGSLKGLGVNAGVNYRGSIKAGSRDARIKFQNPNPSIGETVAAAYDYIFVAPTYATSAGANYTRRFGKYSVRFQINVTNLMNDIGPEWNSFSVINAGQLTNQGNGTALTVAGSNPRLQVLSGFNQPEPRKFTLTTTMSF